MSAPTNRQPAGVPNGGQFAAGSHGRPTIALGPPSREKSFADLADQIEQATEAARAGEGDPLASLEDAETTLRSILAERADHRLASVVDHLALTTDAMREGDGDPLASLEEIEMSLRVMAATSSSPTDAELIAAIERGKAMGAADPSGFLREDLPEGTTTTYDAVDRLAATGIDRAHAIAIVDARQHDISATDRYGRIVPIMSTEQVDTLVAILDPSAPKPPTAGPRPVSAAEIGRVTPERMAKQAREMLDEKDDDARF